MAKIKSIEESFVKFVEGAIELQEALENSNDEIVEIFNDVYKFEEDFYEVSAKIQQMETEFTYNFRRKFEKTGYVLFTKDSQSGEKGHFREVTYFKEGYDVMTEDKITFADHSPVDFHTWNEFKDCMIMIPQASYEIAYQMILLGLDTTDLADQLIEIYKDEQERLFKDI